MNADNFKIKAHGINIHALMPEANTVVNIGGQDSKVISMKNRGMTRQHIAQAVHSSVADRIIAILNRIGFGKAIAFSGGTANNPCIVQMVRNRLENVVVSDPENPSIIGALGAAIEAARQAGEA